MFYCQVTSTFSVLLSGDEYIQCFARVVPGATSKDLSVPDDVLCREEKMVTLEHDFDALQNHPIWTDQPKVRLLKMYLSMEF